jgi:hypothetical protein
MNGENRLLVTDELVEFEKESVFKIKTFVKLAIILVEFLEYISIS